MGRRPQPERRAALLRACTDELLRNGLPGLTLAKMATAAGTSSRMLLYHFTSRDQLVLEALHEPPPDRTPWPEFRARSITDWLPVIEAGLRADRPPDAVPLAPAITATVR